MEYHQRQHSFYNPAQVHFCVSDQDFVVHYAEILDQTCVEFNHVHESLHEVYYCMKGSMNLEIDNVIYELKEHNFAIIKPNVFHHTLYSPRQDKNYFVFIFSMPLSTSRKKNPSDFLPSLELNGQSHFVSTDEYSALSSISQMEKESEANRPLQNEMIKTLYKQFTIAIFRHLLQVDTSPESSATINLAIEITKYMHANYNKKITITEVSQTFHISPRHVNRVFEECFGQSFKKGLNIYRLNYAKNYFMDTDYSIEKISELVGLSSPRRLYELFQEIEGISISEFRAQCRQIKERI